ncbi:MAG: extracellular solute-binding protein [Candidatus Magnetomorum sp.]|nr:extracellular solute-binding protein [Candidatus Magnetomorum sp.]
MKILKNQMLSMLSCVFVFVFLFFIFCGNVFCSEKETLRMLVWEPYLASQSIQQSFIKRVKEEFNVDLKLDVKYVTSDDPFFPALRDDETDVIILSHPSPKDKRFQLIKLNLVLPLDTKTLSNYSNVLLDLQQADYCRENGHIYCVPTARGPYALVYNTQLFKETPNTWNILWDPKFKKKYTLGRDQYEQNVYITALAMGYPVEDMSNYKKLNTPKFQDKLSQLAINGHPSLSS